SFVVATRHRPEGPQAKQREKSNTRKAYTQSVMFKRMGSASLVDRIYQPSPNDFYRNYVRRNIPVVITGVANEWPAVARWSPEYFRTTFAGARVMFTAWESNNLKNDPEDYYQKRRRCAAGSVPSSITSIPALTPRATTLLSFPSSGRSRSSRTTSGHLNPT